MKKIIAFSMCIGMGLCVGAQTIDLQVISSGGHYSEAGGISISWTLGEPVIATFESGDLILTQGFQQPLFTFTGQLLDIPAGWSGISSWVAPATPMAADIFDPVVGNLVILLNPFYDAYWPSMGINEIDPPPVDDPGWVSHHGYMVKVTQNILVLVEGLAEADLSVDLPAGWYTMPVMARNNIPSATLFSQLEDLIIVKEIAGNRIWWPGMGIFTLNVIEPGKSYQIYLSSSDVLDFTAFRAPVPTGPSYAELNQIVNKTPWNEVLFTAGTHTIAIDKSAWDNIEGIGYGDYLGVFTQDGLCAGMVLYTNNDAPTAITAFGNDPTTPSSVDGFIEGEYMSFRLFRPATAEEFNIQAFFDLTLPNTDMFQTDGLSKITSFTTVLTSVDEPELFDVELYPNPGWDIVTIRCIGNMSGDEILTLYSMETGQMVKILRLESNQTELDITSLAQGIYFVKITDRDRIIIKKLVKHSNQ